MKGEQPVVVPRGDQMESGSKNGGWRKSTRAIPDRAMLYTGIDYHKKYSVVSTPPAGVHQGRPCQISRILK